MVCVFRALSETSLLLPTSVFMFDESSLPLELFPSSFLPEIQPTVSSIASQTALSGMDVIVTSSDITEPTVLPQPSEVTLSVSQLLATQSSSLFSEVVTEIVPESPMSLMLSEQVSPIPTPFIPFPPLTPSFLSITYPMEPSSPPPAPSSPLILFPFTSFLLSPQSLSTSQVGITPTTILQLETSTTLLFLLPSTTVEPLVSYTTEDMALSSSQLILQPSSDLMQTSHTIVTSMLPIVNPMTNSPVTIPEASTIVQPSPTSTISEGLASSMQLYVLQSIISLRNLGMMLENIQLASH